MEKRSTPCQRQGLMEMLRRQRRDPAGDLPFDPEEDEPQEDGEER